MRRKLIFEDFEQADYELMREKQSRHFQDLINEKTHLSSSFSSPTLLPHRVFFVEHFPVYTLGKNGIETNLLVSSDTLKEKGAVFVKTDRGGDITFHGPGQLVVYPVLDLEDFGIGVREYIFRLEECVIQCLQYYGLEGKRLEGAAGVWIGSNKICAIGVRCSRYVSMHGIALNVNTDLNFFHYINPCGFTDKGVTSLAKETGKILTLTDVRERFCELFRALFLPLNKV